MATNEILDDVEALNAFILIIRKNYDQLYADFASVLVAQGGSARVPISVLHMSPTSGKIDRQTDPITGAAIFRFMPDTR